MGNIMNEYIDHTNLLMGTTYLDIKKLCDEAIEYKFKSVCIHPYYVSYAKEILCNTNIKICTVIGFPLGMNKIEVKKYETFLAIEDGADEIDMVINVSALKNKDYEYVKTEIDYIKKTCKNKILKVIIETSLLNYEEIKIMTKICSELQVDYIKTSTGFGSRGASLEDIEIINKYKDNKLLIKASGGIKTYLDCKKYIDLKVNRIGTSNGVKIMEEQNEIN